MFVEAISHRLNGFRAEEASFVSYAGTGPARRSLRHGDRATFADRANVTRESKGGVGSDTPLTSDDSSSPVCGVRRLEADMAPEPADSGASRALFGARSGRSRRGVRCATISATFASIESSTCPQAACSKMSEKNTGHFLGTHAGRRSFVEAGRVRAFTMRAFALASLQRAVARRFHQRTVVSRTPLLASRPR